MLFFHFGFCFFNRLIQFGSIGSSLFYRHGPGYFYLFEESRCRYLPENDETVSSICVVSLKYCHSPAKRFIRSINQWAWEG